MRFNLCDAVKRQKERGIMANTKIAYKLFRVKKSQPGKIWPLYVLANEETPMGEWLEAKAGIRTEDGKVKSKLGKLAYRPGWHLSEGVPYVTHIGGKDETGKIAYMPDDLVWCEVEFAADVDYQPEANRNGMQKNGKFSAKKAQLDHVPVNGWYRYKTNPNMFGTWIIAGNIRVNRVVTDEEVREICREQGLTPLERKTPFDFSQFNTTKAA